MTMLMRSQNRVLMQKNQMMAQQFTLIKYSQLLVETQMYKDVLLLNVSCG
jgi:hypothetical protein